VPPEAKKKPQVFKWLALAGIIVWISVVVAPSFLFSDKGGASLVGTKVPEVLLFGSAGKKHSLNELLRSKTAPNKVLSFWARWCEPCVHEMPLIDSYLPALRARGVEVVLVNVDDGNAAKAIAEGSAWLVAHSMPSLETFYDPEGASLAALRASALPFHLGIDSEATIAWSDFGEIDWRPEKILRRFKK
jgi:thiol-disulfide isomerase/thioredoxin